MDGSRVAALGRRDGGGAMTTTGPERIRVLIVDDDMLVREVLRDYVESAADLECVGVVSDGAKGVAFVEAQPVDVVLMDVQMPVMDGVEATGLMTANGRDVRVVILTSFDSDDVVREAFRAGAVGFLLKDTSPAGLVDAVRAAHRGMRVVSGDPFDRWSARDAGARETVPELTDRELDVLSDLCRGLSNAEISAARFLSASLVKVVIMSLMAKLDARNRVMVVVRAHQLGLDRPRGVRD